MLILILVSIMPGKERKTITKEMNDIVEVGISKIGNCLKRSLKSIQTSYGVYALKQIN